MLTAGATSRWPICGWIVVACCAMVAGACNDQPSTRPDGWFDAALDGGGEPDTQPSSCDPELLGTVCHGANECGPVGVCLRDNESDVGVCVCECTPDDPSTPVYEDDCPRSGRFVCAATKVGTPARNFCFERCRPELGFNPCRSPLSCRPESVQLTGTRQAVCAGTGCSSGDDCPVWTDTACDLAGSGVACPAGQRCLALYEGAEEGRCVMAGVCDAISGICAPRTAEEVSTPKLRLAIRVRPTPSVGPRWCVCMNSMMRRCWPAKGIRARQVRSVVAVNAVNRACVLRGLVASDCAKGTVVFAAAGSPSSSRLLALRARLVTGSIHPEFVSSTAI